MATDTSRALVAVSEEFTPSLLLLDGDDIHQVQGDYDMLGNDVIRFVAIPAPE